MKEYLLFFDKDCSTETSAPCKEGNAQRSAMKRREKHPLILNKEKGSNLHVNPHQILLIPQTPGAWDKQSPLNTGTVWMALPLPHTHPPHGQVFAGLNEKESY